ncbi:MAG: hypothetical protein ABI724_00385 [Betaproteobacteria bacterium]
MNRTRLINGWSKMRNVMMVLSMMFCLTTTAAAQVSVGIGLPGVSIGINLPVYPQLVRVPNYPVYYAPQVSSNYFFYDGMYWVYQEDNWYASSWYNGPWGLVAPDVVPLFVLRVPVRYYRRPPAYFHGWVSDAPPQWGQHWGGSWEQSHRGWDNWNRSSAPQPAPLPAYQRQYSGSRYPAVAQQQVLVTEHYRYQPRDVVVQQHYQAQRMQSQPTLSRPGRPNASQQVQQPPQAAAPERQHKTPKAQGQDGQAQSKAPPKAQSKEPKQVQVQQQPQAAVQRQQQAPRAEKEAKTPKAAKEPKPSKEKDPGGDKDERKGGDRSK